MKKAGNTQSEIAQALGFSQGTVSKEQKRNTGKRGYSEKQSQKLAEEAFKAQTNKRPCHCRRFRTRGYEALGAQTQS